MAIFGRSLAVLLALLLPLSGWLAQDASAAKKKSKKVDGAGEQKSLLELHNKERSKKGLPLLKLEPKLNKAAHDFAKYMNEHKKLDHEADGSSPGKRMKAAGFKYKAEGENIARGQRSPKAVLEAWMNSPGHRANILRDRFEVVGFGHVGQYWVADFGEPR